MHTGDYKLDETPAGGYKTDLDTLQALTAGGVLAMLGDSTNADRPGRTPTERVVGETIDRLLSQAGNQRGDHRHLSRCWRACRRIMHLAHKYGRKVALTGAA